MSLLGAGDGNFTLSADLTTPSPRGLDVGDLNGDLIPDLVVGRAGCAVGVFLGQGGGAFAPATPVDMTVDMPDARLVDLDGDLALDLVVCASGRRIAIARGNGDGTFQNVNVPTVFNHWVHWNSIDVGDYNEDSIPDLLLATLSCCLLEYAVLLGNPDGTFQPAIEFNLEERPREARVADMNGDGHDDIVTMRENRGLAVRRGSGTKHSTTPSIRARPRH